MSLRPVDILIEIRYGFNDKRAESCVYTNARTEALDELLGNCVQDQMFRGRDPRPLNESLDLYTVSIGYFLDDDCFSIESDTNNYGMDVGIIMAVMGELHDNKITVKELKERP